jgi:putative ABC transport system substrate-binding protein
MQFDQLKGREFITLLVRAAVAAPLAARAQQPRFRSIGYFYPGLGDAVLKPTFRNGLSELGFVEGRNGAVEYRHGRNDPLPST